MKTKKTTKKNIEKKLGSKIASKLHKSRKANSKSFTARTKSARENSHTYQTHSAASTRRVALGRGLSSLLEPTFSVPVSSSASALPSKRHFEVIEGRAESRAENRSSTETINSVNHQIAAINPVNNGALADVPTSAEDWGSFVGDDFSPTKISSLEHAPEHEVRDVFVVDINLIAANPNQPRKIFSEAELESLTNSIRETGLLQPIVVRRKHSQDNSEHFEIVAGERRYRAALRAKLQEIPVILKQLSDKEALEIGIIENIQRADLNPIEEAQAYARLQDEFGSSHVEIAKTVGKDRTSVVNALRLLKLPAQVLHYLETGKLTAGHGRALLMLEDGVEQIRLAEQIVQENISVRSLERLAQEKSPKKRSKAEATSNNKTPQIAELENRLRRALGTKVSLNMNVTGAGEMRVSFFSHEEFERILERINA
ncbi:ParB/RepB/Spo0J family partition protein [bacterium]|nr:ParB/RepB/Spo0J family partition protein [bacterium]